MSSLLESVDLFESYSGKCPYLPTGDWVNHCFIAPSYDSKLYENLLNLGFRRSGVTFYQNHCPNCTKCIPIRILVDEFKPSKKQRRVINKNQDIRIERKPNEFTDESFELYQKYARHWHGTKKVTAGEYIDFLIQSPIESEMMHYYIDKNLVGVGWIDVLPNSLSSVYFAFDPEYSKRSLGTFSLIQEIELTKQQGKKWLYLGFWVEESRKMNYKNQYHPYELLIDNQWVKHTV